MSEEEKKQRLSYRKNRKRILTLQCIILIIAALATVLTGALAIVFNKTYYVDYTEKSTVDYGVHLKDNSFYEESYLGKDHAYIATLIDKVQAKFTYELLMNAKKPIEFEYAYRVNAVVEIKDRSSGKILFAPSFEEVAPRSADRLDTGVYISETVKVDYQKYNEIATDFIETYNLDATASLSLKMYVDVVSASEEFYSDENKNSYVNSISIPLTTKTVDVKITSAVPPEGQKILSYTTENLAKTFKSAAIVLAAVTVILSQLIWLYAYLSRNVDITYDIKVARLVRNYKSFIQKIRNNFSTAGHQILLVDTFDEMLEIRDTIQSPILMRENEDKTCTRFYIPTLNSIVYVYEIKVDDYDEIYGNDFNEGEELIDTPVCDPVTVYEPVRERKAESKPKVRVIRSSVAEDSEENDNGYISDRYAEPSIYIKDGETEKQTKKIRVRISLNEEK